MDSHDPLPPPPAPPPAPDARPPLRRPVEGRLLGGVAAGAARALDVPAWIVRVGFVLLAVISLGLGLFAYVAAWALVPDDAGQAVMGGGARRDVAIVVVAAVAGLVALRGVGIDVGHAVGRSLPWWVLLGGVVLLLRRTDRPHAEPGPSLPTGPVVTDTGDAPVGAPAVGSPAAGSPIVGPPVVTPRPVVRRPRTPPFLGPITWCVALVVLGVMGMLAVRDVSPIGPGIMAAVAMVIFGVGLTVSAVVGRARGLLLPALALGLGLGGLAALDVRADTVAAPFDVRVTDPARLQDTYRAAAGTATLDLADLETPAATPSGSPRRVEVELTAGQLRLVVPTDVRTRVVVHARNGTAYRAAASGRIATNDPELVARWRAAGIPRPGSALDSAALARLRNGELETWDRTLTNGRSLTTGPRGDVDLVVDATVGLGDIVVVEPVWSELPTKLIEPEQLCTVGGGPRGVVEPCSEVAADQRVALCLNDGGYLVDCREDRPASWDNPRIAACRDSGGQPIDCAAVGIDPAGAELVSPDAGEDPSATIAPADPTDPTDPTVTGDPALSPDPTDPSLPPGTVAPAPTLTVPPIGG